MGLVRELATRWGRRRRKNGNHLVETALRGLTGLVRLSVRSELKKRILFVRASTISTFRGDKSYATYNNFLFK